MDESKSRSQPPKGQTNIQSQQAITLCQSRRKPELLFITLSSLQLLKCTLSPPLAFIHCPVFETQAVIECVCLCQHSPSDATACCLGARFQLKDGWGLFNVMQWGKNTLVDITGHQLIVPCQKLGVFWLICPWVQTGVWHPSGSVCDIVCLRPQTRIDSGKPPCESDNAIWGPARWLGLCWAAAGGEGGSYWRLMVVHALSLVRHSHGNTSTVHGANSSPVC